MNSSYPTLGGTDNTVTRLFGLSYPLCLIWAGLLLAIATAVSVLLAAMA